MNQKNSFLLLMDAVVNLILGIVLLVYPTGISQLLGLPATNTFFYTGILGGVLFGIGLALVLECWGNFKNLRGLSLDGAIVINLCGGVVLAGWLLTGGMDLPNRGMIILWTVDVIVLSLAILEFITIWRTQKGSPDPIA